MLSSHFSKRKGNQEVKTVTSANVFVKINSSITTRVQPVTFSFGRDWISWVDLLEGDGRDGMMVNDSDGFNAEVVPQDEDLYKQYKEDKSKKKSYDERAMIIEVLTAGGDSNLRFLLCHNSNTTSYSTVHKQ